MYKHSSVLLETNDGKLLFHHRDDKPDIANPNKIGTFGGGVDNGESYVDAAIRELKEELNLSVTKNQLVELISQDYTRQSGDNGHIALFIVKNVNPANLVLNPNEGQGIVIVSQNDNLNKYNFTQGVKRALNYYWNTNLQ